MAKSKTKTAKKPAAKKSAPRRTIMDDIHEANEKAEAKIEKKAKVELEATADVTTKPETKAKKAPRKAKEDPAALVADIPAPKVSFKSNVAPSVEIATQLQHAFDHFNRRLFKDKLEPVIFSNVRLKKTLGYFWPSQWARRADLKGKAHEIGLDFSRLHGETDKEVMSTLVHEMAHQLIQQIGKAPAKPYHCKFWVAAMHMVGLNPIILDTKGQPTGKLTGPNSSHEIVKGGKFDEAASELLKEGFKFVWKCEAVIEPEKKPKAKKKAGAKAKHTCPECEANAWGKPTLKLLCGECEVPMQCEAGYGDDEIGDDENMN